MGIEPIEKHQLIDEQLNTGAEFKPKWLGRFFTSSIVQRSFSYLFGFHKDSGVPVKVRTTAAGALLTSSVGGGKTINDTKKGNAPNAYSAAIDFDAIMVGVDVWCFDNTMTFKRSVDGITWNDEFEIPADTHVYFEADTHSFNIENKVADSVARYSIVGWR